MRARWCVAWLLLGVAGTLACALAATRPVPTAPASVAVDVYGGLGAPRPAIPKAPKRVSLVVDVTASMLERSPAGASHIDSARASAAEFLYSLREGTEISIRALGHVDSDRCAPSERIAGPVVPTRREPLVHHLQDLVPGSEGSLAASLVAERRDLIRDAAATRTRVVVFTDLDGSCGGDLCSAAEKLVDAGAWLEVVTLGNATPPGCLEDLSPSAALPERVDTGLFAAPRSFRVERARAEGRPDSLLAVGHAGEGPVEVPAGLVRVVLDLDPPEEIGPFVVRPGEAARVRLLEAFDAALPTRVWRVERRGQPVARAFPPPSDPSSAPRKRAP